jgi:hypothetical protein
LHFGKAVANVNFKMRYQKVEEVKKFVEEFNLNHFITKEGKNKRVKQALDNLVLAATRRGSALKLAKIMLSKTESKKIMHQLLMSKLGLKSEH